VDHEVDIVGEFEPDDLEQVADAVGSDGKDLWWVGFGFKIDDGEGRPRARLTRAMDAR